MALKNVKDRVDTTRTRTRPETEALLGQKQLFGSTGQEKVKLSPSALNQDLNLNFELRDKKLVDEMK